MKDLEKIETEFAQADKEIEAAKKFLSQFRNFIAEYEGKEKVFASLTTFYRSENWLEARERLHKELPSKHFAAAGEDTIWDIEEEFRELNNTMLKLISDCLHKEIES